MDSNTNNRNPFEFMFAQIDVISDKLNNHLDEVADLSDEDWIFLVNNEAHQRLELAGAPEQYPTYQQQLNSRTHETEEEIQKYHHSY